MFELLLNGTGDAFSRRRHGTNFLLRKGDFVLAVDCPDAYRRALLEHGFERAGGELLDVEHIDAMFLTHLHGDHVNGLEMTVAYRAMVSSAGALPLYTTPEVAQVLWEKRLQVSLGQMWDGEAHRSLGADTFFELHVVPWGVPTQLGPFTVETRPTIHHIPTAGLRIADEDAVLGYSCDTIFDREHVDWIARDADLILHESTFGKAHTALHELLELPQGVRDRMLVVHYPDEMMGADTELALGEDGRIYEVGK